MIYDIQFDWLKLERVYSKRDARRSWCPFASTCWGVLAWTRSYYMFFGI